MVLEMLYQNCNVKEKLHILKHQWADLIQKPEHQKIRIKDAADILNVSEAELLSTTIGEKSDFLRVPNWLQLFKEIVSLGPMMYLVRNDYAVHEMTIPINNVQKKTSFILLWNEDEYVKIIDSCIKYAFYTSGIARGNKIYSIQMFDSLGKAILKIYLKNDKLEKFKEIKNQYKTDYDYELQKMEKRDSSRTDWNKSDQEQLDWVIKDNFSITKYLEDVVTNNKKISIQISNDGAESMYSGTIKNVIHKFGWLNIMDPTFNLHVKDMQINKIWADKHNKDIVRCFHNRQNILNLNI